MLQRRSRIDPRSRVWRSGRSPPVSLDHRSAIFTAPAIGFAKNVVIVAAMGTKATDGYSIAVDEVRIVAGTATASVTEGSAGWRCIVTQALTEPVAFVVAPRFAGEATFVERSSQHTCP